MGRSIKLAWRNMWRNWRRTAIALTAMVLGVILLLLMDGAIKGSDQALFGNAVRLYGGNVMVHAPGYREKEARLPLLPLADPGSVVQAARRLPDVLAATQRINTSGMVISRDANASVEIVGIEPDGEAAVNIQARNVSEGRFLQAGDADALFIGKGLADDLHVVVGDRVALVGRSMNYVMRQRTMNVVGIYSLGLADAEKGRVFMNLPEAQSLYNLGGQATEVNISLQSVGQEGPLLAALQAALPTYEVDSWQTLRPEIRQAMDTKFAFTSFFGLVVVFIACIGVLNLMMMAVFERTREMGVLAALGLKGREVMALFLLEGSMIGAVGAVLGCLLGVGLVLLLARQGIDVSYANGVGEATALLGGRIYPMVTLNDLISRAITVIAISALASLYPAWQASRKEPAQALHHV